MKIQGPSCTVTRQLSDYKGWVTLTHLATHGDPLTVDSRDI